jgi:hypothetical protein
MAGTYTLVVSSYQIGGTGTYGLYAVKVPGALSVPSGDEGGALTNGGVHNGTITIGDLDAWTIDAASGDSLTLRAAKLTGTANFALDLQLYDPAGARVDYSSGYTDASVTHRATMAGTYTLVVSSYQIGGTGTYSLYSLPTISSQPQGQSVSTGSSVTFTVGANGTPPPTYQWHVSTDGGSTWTRLNDAAPYSGTATGTLTITGATMSMNGYQYRCLINGGTTSVSATLTVRLTAGDFDGDSQAEILWQNTVNGDRGFWLMNKTAASSWVFLGKIPTEWSIAGTGDFDGDGQTDILWQNTVTGDRGFWLMNKTAPASWAFLRNVPIEWSIAGTGDFDGDGQTDILWQNTVTGDRGIWLMNKTEPAAWVFLGNIPNGWSIRN